MTSAVHPAGWLFGRLVAKSRMAPPMKLSTGACAKAKWRLCHEVAFGIGVSHPDRRALCDRRSGPNELRNMESEVLSRFGRQTFLVRNRRDARLEMCVGTAPMRTQTFGVAGTYCYKPPKMNTHIVYKTLRGLLPAFFVLAFAAQAQADPNPQMFVPVTSAKQARSIIPGEKIAFACANCGAITMLTVDKDRTFLHGYTCPHCKLKYVMLNVGGQTGSVGGYFYEDDAGHHAKLMRAVK